MGCPPSVWSAGCRICGCRWANHAANRSIFCVRRTASPRALPPERHDLRTAEAPARRVLRPYPHIAELCYHFSFPRAIQAKPQACHSYDVLEDGHGRRLHASMAELHLRVQTCRAEGGDGVPPCRPLGPLELMKVTPQRVEPAEWMSSSEL